MRLLHKFLWRFPVWVLGIVVTVVSLAIAAAQVWAPIKSFDEWAFRRAFAVLTAPLFYWVAGAVILLWLFLTWRTWPLRVARTTAARTSPSPSDYIPIEDAGRWLYENATERLREVLKVGVPNPFDTIAEHAAAYYRTSWTDGRCDLHGRWEPGLPMEKIDPKGGNFSAFETVFGSDRKKVIDLSVMRRDLRGVLDYYESAAALPSREPIRVKRDTPLREALMFFATGRWGMDPMADGGERLEALGSALQEFRQHASDGTVTVWGKTDNHGVWRPIDQSYWINHWVDLLDVLRAKTRTKAYNQLGNEPLYIDLMVCRAEFEQAWNDAR